MREAFSAYLVTITLSTHDVKDTTVNRAWISSPTKTLTCGYLITCVNLLMREKCHIVSTREYLLTNVYLFSGTGTGTYEETWGQEGRA